MGDFVPNFIESISESENSDISKDIFYEILKNYENTCKFL